MGILNRKQAMSCDANTRISDLCFDNIVFY